MKTVCIESPLAGNFTLNISYARACLRYCLERGVSPYAAHLLLPQVYNDLRPEHREAGIQASHAMGNICGERWFFIDLGFSEGMRRAWAEAENIDGQCIRQVELGAGWQERYSAMPTPGF